MADLYKVPPEHPYKHQRAYFESMEDQMKKIQESSTLYVGNLAFSTAELQIVELFSLLAPIKKFVMGINRYDKKPCGFCFVEYYSHKVAQEAMDYFKGCYLDGRIINIELDWGYSDGRQYGKGKDGGQVRDNIRKKQYDPDRDTRAFGNKYMFNKKVDYRINGGKR